MSLGIFALTVVAAFLASLLSWLVTRPVAWRQLKRGWFRLCYSCALRKFRGLLSVVEDLFGQWDDRVVTASALQELATELDSLSVFPPAIVKGEHAGDVLRSELIWLRDHMAPHRDGASADQALALARRIYARSARRTRTPRHAQVAAATEESEKRRRSCRVLR